MSDHLVFVTKGVIAFAALMLYAYHLWQIKDKDLPSDQRWRFAALFLGGAIVFYASLEQIETGEDWDPRHLGALAFVTVLLIAAMKSIRAEHRRLRNSGLHGA